jgi:hypothetical protein
MAAENNRRGVLVSWPVSPACIWNMMGEPAYVLIVHSSDPTCGKGDNYKVEVYISGAGSVDLAKLYVSIPAYIPETIEILPDGRRLTVKTKQPEYTEIISSRDFKAKLDENNLHSNVFDLTVSHYLFIRIPRCLHRGWSRNRLNLRSMYFLK